MRVVVFLTALVVAMAGPFAASASEWREARTEHFLIVSGGPEKDLVRFAERLEQFHALLGLASGIGEGSKPKMRVRVFLVANEAEVQRLMGAPGSQVAGFYRPEEGGAIAVVPRNTGGGRTFTGQLVLFHEYTHHYMLQYTPAAYPAWYVEGFAELNSTASFERKGIITYGKPASHRQYELEYAERYSPADMVDGTYLKDRERKRGWSYGDAWLLTHYLTLSDERPGQLRRYLFDINRGAELAEAAAAFGDLGELRKDVGAYLRARSFPYKPVPLPEVAADAITLRILSPAEADLVPFEIELDRITSLPGGPGDDTDDSDGGTAAEGETAGPDEDTARAAAKAEAALARATRERDAWLQELAAIAQRHGGEAAPWRLLARARCASEDYPGCREAADRALALAPDDARAMVYKANAMVALARDVTDDGVRQAEEAAAGALVERAMATDDSHPEVLLAYHRSDNGSDAARMSALMRAVQLVPQLSGPRLTLAYALVARGRLGEARTILRPLAYAPHGGSASEAARDLLETVEARLAGRDGGA